MKKIIISNGIISSNHSLNHEYKCDEFTEYEDMCVKYLFCFNIISNNFNNLKWSFSEATNPKEFKELQVVGIYIGAFSSHLRFALDRGNDCAGASVMNFVIAIISDDYERRRTMGAQEPAF